jgi:hypothetical protein
VHPRKKAMVMKVLFFDTCAVLKYWIDEPGHEVVRWICDPATKVLNGLSFSTSAQVEKEFHDVLDRKAKNGEISSKFASSIKDRAKPYFDTVFHIRDSKPIPRFKFGKETNEAEIISKYNLNPKKSYGDAKIISCVVNYLRFLGGSSIPQVVTSDQKFKKVILCEGYGVIDPEKQTKNEIEFYLSNL